jgi:hypothetical protein
MYLRIAPMLRRQCTISLLLLISAAMSAACGSARGETNGPVRVELRQIEGGGWRLLRAGEPFFIKGAGGSGGMKLLADCGGNSVRTWGADEGLQYQLDEAQRLGLTVAVGLWLGHERHGFDYNDPKQVAEQFERSRKAILRYKDHPAVLMWGIGNEMEGYAKGDNPAMWKAVNDIAALAKQLDPNHPTMTVIAEIGGERVPCIHRLCPAVDVIGVNSYGGGPTLAKRYRAAGGTKPFLFSEFGPAGAWESPKTAWGAPIELSSTAKADVYRKTYESSVLAEKDKLCLGSYAFVWGSKQEATTTWFGILLPDGSRTAAADTLTELWSGRPPANRCPQIRSLQIAGETEVAPGAVVRATLDATDPEKDAIQVQWQVHREAEQHATGGDRQAVPPTYPDAIIRSDSTSAEVRAPAERGGYRLFAFVRDGHGGAAVANVPFNVR